MLDGKHAELCVFLRLCVEGLFLEASGFCDAVSAGGFSLAQLSLLLFIRILRCTAALLLYI